MKFGSPIAVVGMAGVLPGAANPDRFWRNIVGKATAVREIPGNRWGVDPAAMFSPEPMPDKAYSRRACLVRDFQFDSRGFSLDPNLLEALDPLHHLVLTVGKKAFESCNTRGMSRARMGVALAAIALPTDGASFIAREILGKAFEQRALGRDASPDVRPLGRERCLAGRVTSLPGALLAEALELGAGAFTLDAACASSLYAVKLACDELHAG
ncbi:MAG: beta-ketoacyl synthase, partial [Desulfobacterales bacterium]|nr:beta-ketoacyl synthase [Desulfobacterales bacterium]